MTTPLLGAHVSTAGGLATAFPRARQLGCDALQIFVKSPNQWRAKPLAEPDAAAWRQAHGEAGAPPVVAHAAYLINLAATSAQFLEQSRAALADELARAARLGLAGVVVHPGAHLGAGVDEGLTAVAASIDAVLGDGGDGSGPRLLLELTAGQGSALGHRLEELAAIRERTRAAARVAYCLDTCHAFAAGYELGTASAVEEFLAAVDRVLGLERVECLHLNDSLHPLGSRKDRHAHIGEGRIPLAGFARLLAEPRLARVPMVLETEPGEGGADHARDLATLRGLLGGAAPKPAKSPAGKPVTKKTVRKKTVRKQPVTKKPAAERPVSRPRTSARPASKRRSRER